MAVRRKSKPTPEELWNKAEDLFDAAQARNAMYDELDAMYDAEPPANAPDGVKLVRSSHYTNTVDLVVDLASQLELTIEVPLRSETEAAEREADEQEEFLQAWLRQNDETLKQATTMELAYLATQRAVCIAKVLFYDKSLSRLESGDFAVAGSPMVCLVRDPRNCVWEIGVGGTLFMAERFERTAAEIRGLYPDALSDVDAYPDDLDVEWTEVWTPDWVAYYAAQEPIAVAGQMVRAHGYGVVPYAVGVGRVIPRLRARYQPLMRSIAPICRNLDTWYSILLTSGWAAITSAWNVFSDAYPLDGSRELDTAPGAVNFFSRGDQVQPLQRAPLPGDFFQSGDRMLQQLQQATFPFAMYGQGVESMAGYAINLQTQAGRRALAPIWHAIESCYESVFRIVAIVGKRKLEPLIGDEIPLVVMQGAEGAQVAEDGSKKRKRRSKRQVSFKLGNVGDDWQCKVELGDPMPADEASNLRMAIESTQAGLLSKRTARSKYKLTEDDTSEQERIHVEQIVEQLAPLEAAKLAAARGYIPRTLKVPPGWKQLKDGQIVPDLGQAADEPDGLGQGEMPSGSMPEGMPMQPGEMPMMGQGPMPEMPGQGMAQGVPPGLPPELANLPPEVLMQLLAQMQGGGGAAPQGMPPGMQGMPGMPPSGVNPADMQALSGQGPVVPELDEMAGEPGVMMPGMM